jgi:hypothetical protein
VSAFHWLLTPKVSGQLSYDLFFKNNWRNFARKAKFEIQNRVFLFLFPQNLLTLLKWRASSSSFSHIWRFSKYESRKSQAPFHFEGNCGHFWRFLKLRNSFLRRIAFQKTKEFATKMK